MDIGLGFIFVRSVNWLDIANWFTWDVWEIRIGVFDILIRFVWDWRVFRVEEISVKDWFELIWDVKTLRVLRAKLWFAAINGFGFWIVLIISWILLILWIRATLLPPP